jgi:membrane-associated phospholipid phosphatase
MRKAAHILSNIFIPLLSPPYLCAIIIIFFPPLDPFQTLTAKILAVVGIMLITAAPPMLFVYVLYKLKIISSTGLEKREDRRLPQLFGCLNYILVFIILAVEFGIHHVFTLCMLSSTLSLCVITLVTRYWKISTHAAGVFGMVAVLSVLDGYPHTAGFVYVYIAFIIIAFLVCFARLYLRVHTRAQVLAGSALAFLVVYSVFYFLGKNTDLISYFHHNWSPTISLHALCIA